MASARRIITFDLIGTYFECIRTCDQLILTLSFQINDDHVNDRAQIGVRIEYRYKRSSFIGL
uniref:Uncharacterized protein n=1 Tax=Romanomermis culicivorax TaxID=13658 RepID=A0A915J387_ROMCU